MATKTPSRNGSRDNSKNLRPDVSEIDESAEPTADFFDESISNRSAPRAARKSSRKTDLNDDDLIEFSDKEISDGDVEEEGSVTEDHKKKMNSEGVESTGRQPLRRADSLDTSKRKLEVDLFEEAKGDFKPTKINRRRSLDMGYCAPKAYTRRSSYNADDAAFDSTIKPESEKSIDEPKKRNKDMGKDHSESESDDSHIDLRRICRRKSVDLDRPSDDDKIKNMRNMRRLSSMSNLNDLKDDGRKLKRRSSMCAPGRNEDASVTIAKMKKWSSLNTDGDKEYDGAMEKQEHLRKSKSCTDDGKDSPKPLRKSKLNTDDEKDPCNEKDENKPLRKSKMKAESVDDEYEQDKKASSSWPRHHQGRNSATDVEEYDKKASSSRLRHHQRRNSAPNEDEHGKTASSSRSKHHRGRNSATDEDEYDKKYLPSGSGHHRGRNSAVDEDENDKKSLLSRSRHHRGRNSATDEAETPIPTSPLTAIKDDVAKGDESRNTDDTAPASTPGRRGSEADIKRDPKGKGRGEQRRRSKRRTKRRRRGFCALCLICTVYMFTICLACALGIWFGMKLLLEDKESAVETMKIYLHEFMVGKQPLNMSQTMSDGNSTWTGNVKDEDVDESNLGNLQLNFTMENKGVPASSEPTFTKIPSFNPTSSPLVPTSIPSHSPTAPFPTSAPSYTPSTSVSPSSSPTGLPGCPERLLKSVELGSSALTMYYEIIKHNDALSDKGGLFCVSIEYKGAAGWLGVALSEASRDPAFGRKEAIIGIPGIKNAIAVAKENSALGQQNSPVDGAPYYVNPGKYEIPAGGYDGYSGPSLSAMRPYDYQTLTDAWTNTTTDDDGTEITQLAFTKYLREPGEINLNPFKSTLFLYAVAPFNGRNEYDSNPQWEFTYLQLMDGTAVSRSFFSESDSAQDTTTNYLRKRLRQPRKAGY